MKTIVHIAIANFYREGMGYQENILPVKHIELGYDVHMITTQQNSSLKTEETYINPDGIKVHKLVRPYSVFLNIPILNICTNKTKGLSQLLNNICPDIIFMHGLQAVDNLEVITYMNNNPHAKLFVDQHADYYNTPLKTLKQIITQKVIYKYVAHRLTPFVEKFWGVTPWRVHYLKNVYKIPENKVGLLVMGGDEKLIPWGDRDYIRKDIRSHFNIPDDAFVIITGGKINRAKNIHILLEAVKDFNDKKIYTIVFGTYDTESQQLCEPYTDNHVINLGWIDSKGVYPYYLASDLGVFPGTHSVLWEQACASGLPCIFKDWDGGMSHVKVGDNALLIKEITLDSIKTNLLDIVYNKEKYSKMKQSAEIEGRKEFSYIEIAKRSINIV